MFQKPACDPQLSIARCAVVLYGRSLYYSGARKLVEVPPDQRVSQKLEAAAFGDDAAIPPPIRRVNFILRYAVTYVTSELARG